MYEEVDVDEVRRGKCATARGENKGRGRWMEGDGNLAVVIESAGAALLSPSLSGYSN